MATLLILGSKSDLGIACAYQFAQQGIDLILAARSPGEAQEQLAADLRIRFEVNVSLVPFDALQYDTHQRFYEELEPKPDIVLSVFGYLGDAELAAKDFQEAYRIMNANYCGHVSILDLIVDNAYIRQQGLRLIGVSSVAGDRGRAGNYHYGSAKAAFTAYLSGLRQRFYNSNIHVISIIPGYIQTKMLGDLQTPGFLTSEPSQLAKTIWRAYDKKKDVVYSKFSWWVIMEIIKALPEFIFKRLKL